VKELETTQSSQLNLEALQGKLDTQFFGADSRLVFVPVVDSTNILAMQLARQGAAEGTVVLTDSQTAGKGRLGRQWLDVQGRHVLSSTILRPQFSPYLLVMIASLAVVNAITSVCKVVASIKWPNDILIGNRKVAGILIETSHDQQGRMLAIVGIGVNVNGPSDQLATSTGADQQRPGAAATTLQSECGHVVSREIFIAHLLQNLEGFY
jgi:BirA family biotin operon repressor/biotin-[acetyl-CoA-carboxylase] ligase